MKHLKSFNIDFNWYKGFCAAPDFFTHASPEKIVDWYEDMGVNNFWTFATTYNGYAWYNSKIAPKAFGLKGDFMSRSVELGQLRGMDVFAYLCLGDNPYLISKNSKIARVDEDLFRMPFTRWYIDYFCSLCDEVLRTAPTLDGIVIDWFRYPRNKRSIWIDDEKKLYKEEMGEAFPQCGKPSEEAVIEYERRCIEHAWREIHSTIKSHGDIKIWTNQPFDFIDDPIWNGNILMKEADYILNECPDFTQLDWIKSQSGEHTTVVQNLCGWEGHNLEKLNTIDSEKYGFFGFAEADVKSCIPELDVSAVNYKNIQQIHDFYRLLK